jgi:GT2 family glycosyltransferase
MVPLKEYPSVAVIITARNRPDELLRTLKELKRQSYPNMQVVVIDDASEPSLQSLVLGEWPESVFIRNETCRGLIANRSHAMRSVTADLIVSLDDDSCFTHPNDLMLAVERMQAESRAGILTFRVYAGTGPVPSGLQVLQEQYVSSFIGCGHLIRSALVAELGGYRDFYFYYGEEAEYSLRAWDHGWRVLFFPSVLIHHRVSSANRSRGGILRYSVRNNLWTTLLNMPWPRVALQVIWRLASYTFECFRLLEFRAWFSGLSDCVLGLPSILRMRNPIGQNTLTLLDAVNTMTLTTPEDLSRKRVGRLRFLQISCGKWMQRPRARSFWSRNAGDIGRAETVTFMHNLSDSDRHR